MKKSFKLFLALLLIGGFALSFSSCSDKDVNDSNIEIPGDPYGKTTETGEALFNILGAAAGLDSLPDNWQQNNFTVEPIIGKALDESNPYVRTVVSTSAQEAIDIFNGYTDSEISNDATSGSWTKEGVGSLNLNVINKDGVYATLDINVPQMPHLTQLRFVDQSLVGDNAGEPKKPYYHIGDVVKVTDQGEVAYWVCVRDCNQANRKDRSHWVSFQMLNSKNYETIPQKGNYAQVVLPKNMGHNGDTKRMLKAAVQLFTALNNPECYETSSIFPKGLGEMGKVSYTYDMVTTIAQQWKDQNVFAKVFAKDIKYQDIFNIENLDGTLTGKKNAIYFYSKDGEVSGGWLRDKKFTLGGNYIYINEKDELTYGSFKDSWTADDKSFNIATYVASGGIHWSNIDNATNPDGRTKPNALVVRYSTGAQLCGLSQKKDPNIEQPLPGNPAKGITITDEYHFDGKVNQVFTVGDLVTDNDGSIWTCVLSPCEGNTKTIFITTDGIKTSTNGKVVINDDLPTIKDIFYLYPILGSYKATKEKGTIDALWNAFVDPSSGAIPLDSYMQYVNYKGDNALTANRTTFAVKSTTGSNDRQQLLRIYYGGAGRSQSTMLMGFTTYQDSKQKMYLDDSWDEAFPPLLRDTLTQNYWLSETGKPSFRKTANHTDVAPYLYHRKTGNEEGGFGDSKDFYSIFNEPVAIIRIKILEQNDGHSFTKLHMSPLYQNSYLTPNEWINGQMAAIILGRKDATFLDGQAYEISY